jgi:hypothetical protein
MMRVGSENFTMVSLFKLNVERVAYSLVSKKTFRSTFLGGMKRHNLKYA